MFIHECLERLIGDGVVKSSRVVVPLLLGVVGWSYIAPVNCNPFRLS
jgi:hypothetical protein